MLAELRENRSVHELTAGRHIEVRALTVELPTVVGYKRNTDQVAVDKVCEFRIHEYPHEFAPSCARAVQRQRPPVK
jgi:hypothetical protein